MEGTAGAGRAGRGRWGTWTVATSSPDPGGSPLGGPSRGTWAPSPAQAPGTCGAGHSPPPLQTPSWDCAGSLAALPLQSSPAAPCAAPFAGSCDGKSPCASRPGLAAFLGREARVGWRTARWAATFRPMTAPTATREPACPEVDGADQPGGGPAGSAGNYPWTGVAGVGECVTQGPWWSWQRGWWLR